MIRFRLTAPVAVLAAALTLTACGSPAAAHSASSSTSPSAAATTAPTSPATAAASGTPGGVPATKPVHDLGSFGGHAVPAGWTIETWQGLRFAVPPMSDQRGTGQPQPNSGGYFTTVWDGPPIPEAIIATADGSQAGSSISLFANPAVHWDGMIRDGHPNTFSAKVPGATLVGGSMLDVETVLSRSTGATRPVGNIAIYVQGPSKYYELHLVTSPGEAGARFLRQFLGALSVS